MSVFKYLSLILPVMGFMMAPAIAQDTAAGSEPAATSAAPSDADIDRRINLAKQLHELRPTRQQVYDAIDRVAQNQPAAERESFVTAMRNILNYRAIENISINAMAEVYTAQELESMLEYYQKPEARSAAEKEQSYADKVYPELIRMLDQAMMRLRTGSPQ